jgi:hypothetical protein
MLPTAVGIVYIEVYMAQHAVIVCLRCSNSGILVIFTVPSRLSYFRDVIMFLTGER